MTSEDESREQGVEFGPLEAELEQATFPMDKAALLEEFGDQEIELQDGSQTVREVLAPYDEQTFDSLDDLKQAVIGMVSDEAIGRKQYDDRGGVAGDEGRSDESL